MTRAEFFRCLAPLFGLSVADPGGDGGTGPGNQANKDADQPGTQHVAPMLEAGTDSFENRGITAKARFAFFNQGFVLDQGKQFCKSENPQQHRNQGNPSKSS